MLLWNSAFFWDFDDELRSEISGRPHGSTGRRWHSADWQVHDIATTVNIDANEGARIESGLWFEGLKWFATSSLSPLILCC